MATGPVPLIRSWITSFLGAGPVGTTTGGFVLSAAGSGVALVLVAVVEAALLAVVAVVAVVESAVAPAEGAS